MLQHAWRLTQSIHSLHAHLSILRERLKQTCIHVKRARMGRVVPTTMHTSLVHSLLFLSLSFAGLDPRDSVGPASMRIEILCMEGQQERLLHRVRDGRVTPDAVVQSRSAVTKNKISDPRDLLPVAATNQFYVGWNFCFFTKCCCRWRCWLECACSLVCFLSICPHFTTLDAQMKLTPSASSSI